TSEDFSVNLARLREVPEVLVREISTVEDLEEAVPSARETPSAGDTAPERGRRGTGEQVVIVDALLGSGINKPLDGLLATVADRLNSSGSTIVSVDVPSGLPADAGQWDAARYGSVISADITLTFQVPKTSFL